MTMTRLSRLVEGTHWVARSLLREPTRDTALSKQATPSSWHSQTFSYWDSGSSVREDSSSNSQREAGGPGLPSVWIVGSQFTGTCLNSNQSVP